MLIGSKKIRSVDVWESAKFAWECIISVNNEILFQTLYLRMEQIVECNGRNDMPINRNSIRQHVHTEDSRLKNISTRMMIFCIQLLYKPIMANRDFPFLNNGGY